jgi:hypothetical protein
VSYEIKNSDKLCPRCTGPDRPHLRWSEHEHPPTVNFSTWDGRIQSVSIMRYCIACGYREVGFLRVDAMPTFREVKEE